MDCKKHGFATMEGLMDYAKMLSKAKTIPRIFKDSPSDIILAMDTAKSLNVGHMTIMNNTTKIVNKCKIKDDFGKPVKDENGNETYEVIATYTLMAKFLISLVNRSGLYTSGIRHRMTTTGEKIEGTVLEDMKVEAYLFIKETNEKISKTFSMRDAIREGYTRNPKYRTSPETMLEYRAGTLLARSNAPETLNGLYTPDEIEDIACAQEAREAIDVSPPQIQPKVIEEKIEPEEIDVKEEIDKALAGYSLDEVSKTNTSNVTCYDQHELSVQALKKIVEEQKFSQEKVKSWCDHAKVETMKELSLYQVNKLIDKFGKEPIVEPTEKSSE